MKLGIFGSVLGVIFLALAAASPVRTAESGQPALEKPATFSGTSYTVQGRMFLGADGNLSYLRFLNLSGTPAIVTATMVGSPSGKNYGTATVNIANHASRQLSITDLMGQAKVAGLDSTDDRMGVYLRADASPVAVQNVLFAGATGFFENMTTCQNSSVSDTNTALMNVHTTSITGFPSYVTIYNYSSNEQAYDVGVYEANTGTFKGQVTVPVPANGTFEQPFSWFQDQLAWSPGPSEYHANLTVVARSDSRSSQLSHTVYNAKLNVFLNLTAFCNIESTATSLPTAVNDTLSNATAGLAYSIPSTTLLSNDLNAAGATITDVTTPTTNGTANGGIIQTGNELVYVPARAGIVTFQYRLRVGAVASNVATVTVTVADNGPIAEGDRLVSLNFTTGLPTTIPLSALTANDRNTANTRLVNVTSPMTTGTVNGTLTLTSDGLVYTAARPGTVTFRYQLQSTAGTLSNEAVVSLTATGSSGPTTIADQPTLNLVAGQATEIPLRLITANDFNTDGATLDNFTNPTTDGIANGTLTRSGESLIFTPARAGTTVFTYQLRNSQGLSNIGTVTMTVLSATAAPQAENDTLTQPFTAGTQTTILFSTLIANDRAISGAVLDSFTAPSTDGTTNGTVTRIGNDLAYTPARAGVVAFTYTVRTTNGTSNAATVRLIVQ
ncbi:MAG: hypothetical protein K1X51_01590 [Rhodospirillaceae bacterium]|nr:hypothetical protein [Rhodospirillaceae bacterium]